MTNQPDPNLETTYEAEPPPKKKRGFWGTLFRLALSLTLILVLVVVGLAAVLTHYFPSEELRPIAESRLTEQLRMPVTIGRLEFNLLTGFELENVQLGDPEPLFNVDKVILGYDLFELIEGSFTIHQLRVERPRINLISQNGVWNFQPLLDLAGPPSEKEPPSSSSAIPTVPIPVNLTELAINDVELKARMDDNMTAHIEGLSVEAKGKINLQGVDVNLRVQMKPPESDRPVNISYSSKQNPVALVNTLLDTDLTVTSQDINRASVTGNLGLTKTFVKLDSKLPTPDTRLDFVAAVDLQSQTFDLNRLTFNLGKNNQVDLSAKVRRFLANPDFELFLSKGKFDLRELSAIAKPFLPPMAVSGNLKVADLELKGRLKDNQPDSLNLARSDIRLTNGTLAHPPTQTRLQGLEADLKLRNVRVNQLIPESAEASGTVEVEEGESSGIYFDGFKEKFTLVGTGANLSSTKIDFDTDLKQVSMEVPNVGSFEAPANLAGSVNGNLQKGDIENLQYMLTIGDAMKTGIKAKAKQFGQLGFKLEQITRVNFEPTRKLIPKEIADQFGLGALKGQAYSKMNATGNLDQNYMVDKMKAKTRVRLKDLDAEMTQPAMAVQGLSAEVTFPSEVDAVKGVFIEEMILDASLQALNALGKYEAGATQIQSTLKLDQFLNINQKLGRVPVVQNLTLKSEGIKGVEPDIHVGKVALKLASQADVLPPANAENIKTAGNVVLEDISAMGQFAATGLATRFKIDAQDLNLEKTKALIKGTIKQPSVKQEDLELALSDMQFETRSLQNLKSGDVDLRKAFVNLPNVLNWNTRGKVKAWGEQFDLQTRLDKMDLEKLLALVPEQYKESIQGMKLAGKLSFEATAKGKKPSEVDIKKMDIPVRVVSQVNLNGVDLDWPDQALNLKGMDLDTRFTIEQNDVDLKGQMKMASIAKTDLGQELPSMAPEFEFHYKVRDWDRVEVDKHVFSLPGQDLDHSLSGRIEGFRPFLSGKKDKTPVQILRALDVALKTHLGVDIKTISPLIPGLEGDGTVNSNLDVTLIAGQEIDINGEVALSHLNATHESGGKIEDLDGRFLINKSLLLDRLLAKKKKRFNASRKGFFNQLREFSRYKNIFKVGALKFGPHVASNVGMDVYYRGNQLFLDRFLMEILNGSVAGNLFLSQTPEGPELEFSTDFAHLDFNQLIGKHIKSSGRDSEIDGNMKFRFKINQTGADQKISMDQIVAEMNITHIGKEVLDRFLLFMDPGESSPAIVDARSKLDLAQPENLHINVAYGNLSMEIGMILLGSKIESPALKRVPITSLKHFRQVNEQLQILQDFHKILQFLSANGIEFDEEGNISFF